MPLDRHAEDTFNDDGAPHDSLPPQSQQPQETKPYRFVGTFEEISDVGNFSTFGQTAELTDAQWAMYGPRALMITDAEFESCGFTPEDLEKYADPTDHEYYDIKVGHMVKGAPAEFLDKKNKALALMQQRHAKGPTIK